MNLNIIYFSIFVNSILSLIVIFYGKKLFVIDQPDLNRKKHKLPVPLAGGFILIINILCAVFAYNFRSNYHKLGYLKKLRYFFHSHLLLLV